ncbi:hypothetical protein DMA15_03645 [Streptomyces sp. WAC 01529]|uniref:hypothetical protein n=1 Tax=Streptomyces sp. WAC 01529 TaxID=2203205 RepID=UPI000F6D089E|nr:hypothetical protein [Streptomyces sp. WAC 01529]AZM51787.1 hypothetical protein DMA15_03645 [Streptomyces sp. WAC 01529]
MDTEIKIATCNRCGSVVLAAQVSGLAAAADPIPLDAESYRAALIAGRWTYDVITRSGRPWKLRLRTAAVSATPCDIVASHACGARGQDAMGVTEVAVDAPRARVTAIGRPDPPCASAMPQAGPASAVTPRPSRSWPHRCRTCRRLIEGGEPYMAIDHDSYHWAVHDVCPVRVPVCASDGL